MNVKKSFRWRMLAILMTLCLVLTIFPTANITAAALGEILLKMTMTANAEEFLCQEVQLEQGTYTLSFNAKWAEEKGSTIEAVPYFYNSIYGWLKSTNHDTATSGLIVSDEVIDSDTGLHTREFQVVTAGTYRVGAFGEGDHGVTIVEFK